MQAHQGGGGVTFAQDRSAEATAMSLSAQALGFVDFVLPPDKISEELQRLARECFSSVRKQAYSEPGPG